MDNKMAGFYKLDGDSVLYADQGVLSPNYELLARLHDQYVYPVDGWYWFDRSEDAYAYFGKEAPKEAASNQ